ncbi:MAG: response regulator [Myxococcales bacterium]|nr:response regulator [Myxococcales bacterium]
MSEPVLIVDDSLTVRMDLAEAFEAAGFRSVVCANLQEARAALAAEPIRILVLDVLLPDGDGVDFLAEIRASESGESAIVLMLTSESEIKDRVRALQTGANEYVGKPYDANYIIAKAREYVRATQVTIEGQKQTILVIDDSVTYRTTLAELLESAGYQVCTAASGEEGLRMAANLHPTAIVVDGVLPGIDGATVIRRIRLDAALRGTPCLLLTGSEEREAELKALDAGADAFVRKDEHESVILAKLGAALRSATALQTRTASLLGPRKVLVVDDSVTYREELANTLRLEGFEVVLAQSGEEALEMLSVENVDCVLLDLLMPGIGGQETCRRIKSTSVLRDIPLIVLTSLEDRGTMLEVFSAGADDYVPKSSELDVLRARVRAQIRRKQFEDETRHVREELIRKDIEAKEARAAREIAEARAMMADELERSNQELEAFSYTVSHDLRAPLRAIDGFSSILLEDYADKLDDEGKQHLDRLRTAAHRMNELIEDLLRLSRVTRGTIRWQSVNLSEVVEATLEQIRARDSARSVVFRVQPGVHVHGDVGLLRAAFENLLSNA